MSRKRFYWVLLVSSAFLVGPIFAVAQDPDDPFGNRFGQREVSDDPFAQPATTVRAGGGGLAERLATRVTTPGYSWQAEPGSVGLLSLQTPIESRIRARLDEPVEMKFEANFVAEFVDQLSEHLGFQVRIDKSAVMEGLLDDEPVAVALDPDAMLRSGLRAWLKPYSCTYVVRNDGLEVVSQRYAKQVMVVRSYDVSAIPANAQELRDTITHTIDPDMWEDVGGGPGHIRLLRVTPRNLLVVRCLEDQHHQIESFLSGLVQLDEPSSDRNSR